MIRRRQQRRRRYHCSPLRCQFTNNCTFITVILLCILCQRLSSSLSPSSLWEGSYIHDNNNNITFQLMNELEDDSSPHTHTPLTTTRNNASYHSQPSLLNNNIISSSSSSSSSLRGTTRSSSSSPPPPITYQRRNHQFQTHPARNLVHIPTSTSRSLLSSPLTNATTTHHQPLRITFEISNIQHFVATFTLSPQSNNDILSLLTDSILPATSSIWSQHLSVVPLVDPIPLSNDTCYGDLPIVPAELIETGVEESDLVVFVTGGVCGNENQLAYAFPCALDAVTDRPVIGAIHFCINSLPTSSSDLSKTIEVATHELGHILGMNSDLFPYFRDAETGEPLTPRPLIKSEVVCIDGSTKMVVKPGDGVVREVSISAWKRYFEIVTPRVATVVRNQFNCQSLEGARLENQPTNGDDCFGSHWDERLFFSEIMGAVRNSRSNVLSPLTLALLEDTGWYHSKYSTSRISTFGHGAGCSFVSEDCIVDNVVPSYGRGYFCDTVLDLNEETDVPLSPFTCDVSHTRVSACDLVDKSKEGGEEGERKGMRHFDNKNLGPKYFIHADHCPLPIISVRDCRTPSRATPLRGVSFGPSSRCFNFRIHEELITIPTAYCLDSRCDDSNGMIVVTVEGKEIRCEHDGQVHLFPGYNAITFECPRLATVCPHLLCPANCSGRGTCDYSAKPRPQCLCFDENNTSPGCYGPDDDYYDVNNDNSVVVDDGQQHTTDDNTKPTTTTFNNGPNPSTTPVESPPTSLLRPEPTQQQHLNNYNNNTATDETTWNNSTSFTDDDSLINDIINTSTTTTAQEPFYENFYNKIFFIVAVITGLLMVTYAICRKNSKRRDDYDSSFALRNGNHNSNRNFRSNTTSSSRPSSRNVISVSREPSKLSLKSSASKRSLGSSGSGGRQKSTRNF